MPSEKFTVAEGICGWFVKRGPIPVSDPFASRMQAEREAERLRDREIEKAFDFVRELEYRRATEAARGTTDK